MSKNNWVFFKELLNKFQINPNISGYLFFKLFSEESEITWYILDQSQPFRLLFDGSLFNSLFLFWLILH